MYTALRFMVKAALQNHKYGAKQMKNLMAILTLMACFTFMAPISASAQNEKSYNVPEMTPEHGMSFDRNEKKLVMPFAGQDEEQGVIELFVAKNKFSQSPAVETPLADELNRISPAAGVQFRLEF